jgi:GNAT superfamily N-acetyltransferase
MARAPFGVRPAVASDGPAIGDVHAESWLAAYTEIFDHEFLVAAAESRRTGWPNLIEHLLVSPNALLVGELEGTVAAFGHAAPSDELGTIEVCGFYAHPAAWGSGLASVLMTQLLANAGSEFDSVMLWTFRDAPQAHRFYVKSGYTLTGRERSEELTDWSTGKSATRQAVQFAKQLHPDS